MVSLSLVMNLLLSFLNGLKLVVLILNIVVQVLLICIGLLLVKKQKVIILDFLKMVGHLNKLVKFFL